MILAAMLLLQDVDALLRDLASDDAHERDRATNALRTLEPESRGLDSKLESLASGADPEVAMRAEAILRYRRLARHFEEPEEILTLLAHESANVRNRSVSLLAHMGADAIPLLSDLARDPDEGVVLTSSLLIVKLARPQDAPQVRSILKERTVREAALEKLIEWRDPYAREVSYGVFRRYARGEELGSDESLVDAAAAALAGPFRSDEAKSLFRSALIGRRGRTRVMEAMNSWRECATAMRGELLSLFYNDPQEVQWMPRLVAEIVGEAELPTLREWLRDPEAVPVACVALGRLKDAESISALLGLVKYDACDGEDEPSAAVSLAASWALGAIGSREAVPSLLRIWESRRSETVRPSALPGILLAVGRIGDPAAAPALRGALDHPLEEVRWAAAEALGLLGEKGAVRGLISLVDDAIGFTLLEEDPGGYLVWRWKGEDKRFDRTVMHVSETIPVQRRDETVREAAMRALGRITGAAFDGTPADRAAAWRAWWETHADEFP